MYRIKILPLCTPCHALWGEINLYKSRHTILVTGLHDSPDILGGTIDYEYLWKATGQEDINLEIRKRKFRWIGHTLRKEDGEIPKAALHWNPQGKRKRGRPKNSWRSVIKEAGRSWNELRFLAADRQKWKRPIDNLLP